MLAQGGTVTHFLRPWAVEPAQRGQSAIWWPVVDIAGTIRAFFLINGALIEEDSFGLLRSVSKHQRKTRRPEVPAPTLHSVSGYSLPQLLLEPDNDSNGFKATFV